MSRWAGMLPGSGTARRLAALFMALLLLHGCAASDVDPAHRQLRVYATTGYLADALANIAPEAHVDTMVGPGGDPHTYQPSTRDVQRIHRADVVFWNGFQLEAQLHDQLLSLGDRQLAVAEKLPRDLLLPLPQTDAAGVALNDPHVWNSPRAWSLVVGYLAEKLAEVDPANAARYRTNAAAYQTRIASAAAEAERLLRKVPEPRLLVTGHDAFNYFGKTFGFQIAATDFISTDAALGARKLSRLARMIADNRVPVIFQDNQANPQAITSLKEAVRALGWNVEVSHEELYADSLGASPGVDTWLGVFLHNARTIADALGED